MSNKSKFITESGKRYVIFFLVVLLFVGSVFIFKETISTTASTNPTTDPPQSSLSDSFKLSSFTNSFYSTKTTNTSFLALHLDFSIFFTNSSGESIATDNAGNIYVAGTTQNSSLPVKNAFQPKYGGYGDVFVAKFNNTGAIVFCTYFGGNLSDDSSAIAVDNAGNIFITGRTISSDFPTKNAFDKVHESGQTPDAFIAEFNATGGLVFSTYLGGNSNDGANSIAVDTEGNCYVTGPTSSSNFPIKNANQIAFNGTYSDIFISKFSSNGTLLYSRLFGGSNNDFSYSIAVDKGNNVYITGITSSKDFPTINAFQSKFNSAQFNFYDAFVTKFDPNGKLIYSTYLGGSGMDSGESIAVDTNGTCYVTGTTFSNDFPLKNQINVYDDNNSFFTNVFLTKFDSSGNLVFSSYLGLGYSSSIALDSAGNSFITGATNFNNFTIKNITSSDLVGENNVFIIEISSINKVLYTNVFGGCQDDFSYGIAVDKANDIYITGITSSSGFPGYNGTDLTNFTNSGYGDFYLLKLTFGNDDTTLSVPNKCVINYPTGSTETFNGPATNVNSSKKNNTSAPGFTFISLGFLLVLLPFSRKKVFLKKK